MTYLDKSSLALLGRLALGQGDLTVAVKDCIDIAGEVSTCGSAALSDSAPAEKNASVVDAVLGNRCRIIGKANMHELAFGMTGVNAAFGTPLNPRWPERIPGGSSSGSASAVAGGLCDFAIGTDTGGSVRQPAICCGVFGIKPTYGRISRTGCHPAASSLDCVGALARTAEMLTRAMAAMDPSFTPETLKSAPRLARTKVSLEPAVGDALVYGLMAGLPEMDYVVVDDFEAAFEAGMTLIAAEAAQAYGPLLADPRLGADVRARIEAAQRIPQPAIGAAEGTRRRFTAAVDSLLDRFDALITPALPSLPPTLEEAKDPKTVLPLTRFLRPFNLSGHPAIVLPLQTSPDAGPIGFQIVGRKGEDAKLCAIAEWMAATTPAIRKED